MNGPRIKSHVTYEWVMSHINESYHIWMSHVPHQWVMSYMNESCHTWMSHVTYERVMSCIHDTAHSYLTHSDSTTNSPIHMWNYLYICDMTGVKYLIHMRHDLFIWNMTHSYVKLLIHMWHDSCKVPLPKRPPRAYVTWLNHMWRDSFICDMTHSYVTWLIHM